MDFAYILVIAFAVFLVVFVRTELGLYLVIFSMLLSPKLGSGSGELAEGRRVVIRTEDLLLLVVAFTWLAKTAVNKELGLARKTPLNRPILWYMAVTTIATLVGYGTGTVHGLGGFFYVLKYMEYFVVYYMVANNLSDRSQAWRFVGAAFLTAAIVSVIGAAQIPSGQRVSAPFEGTEGEPNTFGGYLIFMMALAGGIALETQRLRVRLTCLALLALMALPFAYTLSRASFLAVPFVLLAFGFLSSSRRVVVGALLLLLVAAPVIGVALLPKPVLNRIRFATRRSAGWRSDSWREPSASSCTRPGRTPSLSLGSWRPSGSSPQWSLAYRRSRRRRRAPRRRGSSGASCDAPGRRHAASAAGQAPGDRRRWRAHRRPHRAQR